MNLVLDCEGLYQFRKAGAAVQVGAAGASSGLAGELLCISDPSSPARTESVHLRLEGKPGW